ncbi:MAG: hypothetical protein JOZ52_09035 [Acidobacteria bacterium]|nr:hypothetical protein [Acidobacteriota bacterium]
MRRIFLQSILLLLAVAAAASAQSTNIEFPTPVVANEVSGVIEARDVGDPRLTRHFYLLTGVPGDLALTVESSNLNGDIDLFTAGSLRPLTKLSIFAGLSTTSVSKSVYLRQRESLILRVEARSANDDPGRYHIKFSGSFEPIADANPPPENVEPTVSAQSRDKNARRVNSAGALIEEPVVEVAKVEPPKPAPKVKEKKTKPEATSAPAEEPVAAAPVKPKTPRASRTTRTRTPARKTPARKQPATTTAKKKEETTEPAPEASAPTPAPAEPSINPRLIIETRDGMRVERYMSEVRRFTVEKGMLVVITNDGKIERRPMTTVLRVTIEP